MSWHIDGKRVLVTGANSGIGKETARALAAQGAHVILHCRDKAKGRAARDEIQASTGSNELSIEVADFARFDQVRGMAERIQDRFDRLDVLINNAGAVIGERRITPDEHEAQFQVNHLAPFLLTHELLPLLETSAPARIINVASEAHRNVTSEPETLESLEGRYRSFKVYSLTKLYNILFTRELARRLDPAEITAACLHPGVIGSNFGSHGPWYVRAFMKLARPFLTAPEDGAQTSIHLATTTQDSPLHGRYFKNEQPTEPNTLARNDAFAQRVWAESQTHTDTDHWPTPSEPDTPAPV